MKWLEKEPTYGDIIRVKISFYYHYGIFVDDKTIIQFGLPSNVTQPPEDVEVLTTDIQTFLNGSELETAVLSHGERKKAFSPDAVVQNALSRIGEKGYHILYNNCEHFVHGCTFGEAKLGKK